MKSFLHSCFRGLMKGLAKLIGGVLLGFLLIFLVIAGIAWLGVKHEQGDAYLNQQGSGSASLAAVSQISRAELEGILRDVYHVEVTRWIQPDLIWVSFAPGSRGEADVQATCQGIANVWAHRSGLDYVRVESWNGNTRLAQATVYNGRMVRPQSVLLPGPEPDLTAATALLEQDLAEYQQRAASALPVIDSWTLAEVESTHGKALAKNKATGWAEFQTFRARFENGKVAEVSVK